MFYMVLAIAMHAMAGHATIFTWKDLVLEGHNQVLAEALAISSADDVRAFRAMLARRDVDPNDYLGSLITMIPIFAEKKRFAGLFGVEDPVYGTPEQIRDFPAEVKILLFRLAPSVSSVDLKFVRQHVGRLKVKSRDQVEAFFAEYPSPRSADDFLAAWSQFTGVALVDASCESLVAQP